MARLRMGRIAFMLGGTLALAACEDGKEISLFKKKTDTDTEIETAGRANNPTSSVKLVERDVEAPEVFQVTSQGLWDGRPSLGGVWVAHPDVKDPERVIIRNEENGKFVVGALFRRERSNPGPTIQVSSDAAAALGMLAGAPGRLNITALRRSEVPVATEAADAVLQPPAEVETASLDPIAAAGAAIDAAEAEAAAPAPVEVAAVEPAPAVAAPAADAAAEVAAEVAAAPVETAAAAPARSRGLFSNITKPYIQVGLFNVEENAQGADAQLRSAGIIPTIVKDESQANEGWRVTVGPASTRAERAELLKKIKELGYKDAYYVKN